MRKYTKKRLSSRKSKLSLRKNKLSLRKMKTNRKMKRKVGRNKSIKKYRNKNSIKKSNLRGGNRKKIKCLKCDEEVSLDILDRYYYKYFRLLDHIDLEIQECIIYVALKIKYNNGDDHFYYIKCKARIYGPDFLGLLPLLQAPTSFIQSCSSEKTSYVFDFVKNICEIPKEETTQEETTQEENDIYSKSKNDILIYFCNTILNYYYIEKKDLIDKLTIQPKNNYLTRVESAFKYMIERFKDAPGITEKLMYRSTDFTAKDAEKLSDTKQNYLTTKSTELELMVEVYNRSDFYIPGMKKIKNANEYEYEDEEVDEEEEEEEEEEENEEEA